MLSSFMDHVPRDAAGTLSLEVQSFRGLGHGVKAEVFFKTCLSILLQKCNKKLLSQLYL